MSRIGKLPVAIPDGVKTTLLGMHLTVKGPKGALERDLHPIGEKPVNIPNFCWHDTCNYKYRSPTYTVDGRPQRTASMEGNPGYSIGEAADLLGISVGTLRLYERRGLILPLPSSVRPQVLHR